MSEEKEAPLWATRLMMRIDSIEQRLDSADAIRKEEMDGHAELFKNLMSRMSSLEAEKLRLKVLAMPDDGEGCFPQFRD